MRFLLGLTCFFVCVVVGFILSLKYVERKNFYAEYYAFNKKLKLEISFAKKTLLEILEDVSKEDAFNKVASESILSGKKINVKFLDVEENAFLEEYFNSVGGSDSASQLNFLNSTEMYLKEKRDFYEAEEKKYRNLYVKMGFLIGLIMFIALL